MSKLDILIIAIPAEVMARLDFWTGEGKFTPTESGDHEWIGRRAGNGAPVLRLVVSDSAQRPTPFVPEFPSRNPSTGKPWTREQFEALSACWPLPSGEIPGPAQA